jgi:hypothetical protein
MAGTADSEYLNERRGGMNGTRFLARSPFRSGSFVVLSVAGLFELSFALFLLLRYTHDKIGESTLLAFVILFLAKGWFQAVRHLQDLQAIYLNESALVEVSSGSALDLAFGIAVRTALDGFFDLLMVTAWLLAIAYRYLR